MQAASYLERAVRAESVPQAFYLLGSVYHDLSRPLPAIRALRNATRLDPTFEEAHHLLGLTYLDRHWRRKALESFRQAQRLNPKKMRYRDLVGYLTRALRGAAAARRGRGRPVARARREEPAER